MWLFALFVAVPLIEIALFIQIGGAIGLGWTLLIVIVTAILGTWLVRQQGIRALRDLQSSFSQLGDPTKALADGAMILFAGALLLTPGFFTDTIGFLLLIPAVRRALFRFIAARVTVERFEMGTPPGQAHRSADVEVTVIEGEFHEVDPPRKPTHGNSGWTRH